MTQESSKTQKEKWVRDVLEKNSQGLLFFLQSLVHSRVEAEDLFQSGAIRAIEKSGDLKDRNKSYPWVLSIFRNLALDFLRSAQRQVRHFTSLDQDVLENIADPLNENSNETVCGCGQKLLGQIPAQYSALLKEVEIEGISVKKVAEKLQTSPNNVSVRLHRARSSLKQAVKEYCQVETFAECLNCDCPR